LLHAFPLNATMWEQQRAALGTRPVLAPDLPGFGRRALGTSELHAFAHAALDDMDAAGIERAVVVGLSMGGYVALRLHALAQARVAGLVLADTRAGADDEAAQAKRTNQAERARREGVGWLEELLPALLGETTRRESPEVLATVRALLKQAEPEGVARALEAMRDRPDSTSTLGAIAAPVLAIVGEEDSLTPVHEARRIADAVPDGSLAVIPRAGHLSNLESPDRFNDLLLEFLE
jgi:pimeloyl-ACP methyl ester carboxylesterase